MVIHDSEKNQLKIEIPLSDLDDLTRYQNALLSILRRINIEKCDSEFKEDLKMVYALLSHTQIGESIPIDRPNSKFMIEHNENFYMVE